MPNDPPMLSPHELARRQAVVDAVWERTLIDKEYRREVVKRRSFHGDY